MKLYTSIGPNPHVVRMFMAEKGIELETVEVDLMAAANRQEPYLSVNPAGQMPSLLLDNGDLVTEVTAICEYLDEKFPGGNLIGSNAEERAQTRRWTRWSDLNVCEPAGNGFRFGVGLQMFKDRMRCLPEASEGLIACAQDKLNWLDGQLEGKDYLAGDRFSLADIVLYCFLAFGTQVGQALNPENKNVLAWFDRVSARPSASA